MHHFPIWDHVYPVWRFKLASQSEPKSLFPLGSHEKESLGYPPSQKFSRRDENQQGMYARQQGSAQSEGWGWVSPTNVWQTTVIDTLSLRLTETFPGYSSRK